MPELPEVETVRRGLAAVMVGRPIVDVLVRRGDLRRPLPEGFAAALEEKAEAWDGILKTGRTHLMDATPIRLGQELGGFARQLRLSVERAERAVEAVTELPVGGTAVGTGINTHPEFGHRVSEELATQTGIAFKEAVDHFEANAQRDGLVECHGLLRTIATSLFTEQLLILTYRLLFTKIVLVSGLLLF